MGKTRVDSFEDGMPYLKTCVSGGLMSYGQNAADDYRKTATFVNRILRGASPQNLPVEQPTNLKLTINRKTANAFGLTLPQELLLRADEIIE